jgi:hypothetical protein
MTFYHLPFFYSLSRNQCAHIALHSIIPVYFAPDQREDTYAGQQGELVPACRVEPSNAEEVSFVLKAITKAACNFTLRSGGHSGWPGASNSDGGVTLSLRRIKHVEVSEDRSFVTLGAGAQWLEVYTALDEHDLAVVGGRAGTVGVGGLLLGGKSLVEEILLQLTWKGASATSPADMDLASIQSLPSRWCCLMGPSRELMTRVQNCTIS